MNIIFEWADYPQLIRKDFFYVSVSLAEVEQYIDNRHRDTLHWSRRFEYPWIYFHLMPYSKSDAIIDIGADGNPFQFKLSKEVGTLYSLDTGQSSIDFVTSIISSEKGHEFGSIIPVLGDVRKLDFPDETFDKVYCISTLEHIPRDGLESAWGEMIRVTKPGGKIAVTADVVIDKRDMSITSPQSQIDYTDILSLSHRYEFDIPNITPNTMGMWVDNLLLAVACMLIVK